MSTVIRIVCPLIIVTLVVGLGACSSKLKLGDSADDKSFNEILDEGDLDPADREEDNQDKVEPNDDIDIVNVDVSSGEEFIGDTVVGGAHVDVEPTVDPIEDIPPVARVCPLEVTWSNLEQQVYPGVNGYQPQPFFAQWQTIDSEDAAQPCMELDRAYLQIGEADPLSTSFAVGSFRIRPSFEETTVRFWITSQSGEVVYEETVALSVTAIKPELSGFEIDPSDLDDYYKRVQKVRFTVNQHDQAFLVTHTPLYLSMADAQFDRNPLIFTRINAHNRDFDYGVGDRMNTIINDYFDLARPLYKTQDIPVGDEGEVVLYTRADYYEFKYAVVAKGYSDYDHRIRKIFCHMNSECAIPKPDFSRLHTQFTADRLIITGEIKNIQHLVANQYHCEGSREGGVVNFEGEAGVYTVDINCPYDANNVRVDFTAVSYLAEVVRHPVTYSLSDVPLNLYSMARDEEIWDSRPVRLTWNVLYLNPDQPFPYQRLEVFSGRSGCGDIIDIPVDAQKTSGYVEVPFTETCTSYTLRAKRLDGSYTSLSDLSQQFVFPLPTMEFERLEAVRRAGAAHCTWDGGGNDLLSHSQLWRIKGRNIAEVTSSCNRGSITGLATVRGLETNQEINFSHSGRIRGPNLWQSGQGQTFQCTVTAHDLEGKTITRQFSSKCLFRF
jgi:hypothetical protein